MKLRLARHPNRLEAKHSRVIEDLLGLAYTGKQDALNAMIEMLTDLHQYGRGSRYAKKLQGLPLWELKTQSRGGQKGGARVYFFVTPDDEAALLNAEVKSGDEPSWTKLREALEISKAYEQGLHVLEGDKDES